MFCLRLHCHIKGKLDEHIHVLTPPILVFTGWQKMITQWQRLLNICIREIGGRMHLIKSPPWNLILHRGSVPRTELLPSSAHRGLLPLCGLGAQRPPSSPRLPWPPPRNAIWAHAILHCTHAWDQLFLRNFFFLSPCVLAELPPVLPGAAFLCSWNLFPLVSTLHSPSGTNLELNK